MTTHDTIGNYYKMNFALQKYHNYSLEELENMWPFEREVYITLVKQWVEEENERINQRGNS